jgi:hypothetical protein
LFFGFGLLAAYGCTAFVGLPLYAIATRFGLAQTVAHCAIGGVVTAAVGCVAWNVGESEKAAFVATVYSLVTGGIAGVAFWQVRSVLVRQDRARKESQDAA